LDFYQIHSQPEEYIMNSCNGKIMTSGRRASGFVLESCDRQVHIDLPVLIECDNIPNNKQEIPSLEVTRHHQHLCDIELEGLDGSCEILLLLGRDVPYVHRILDQRFGHPNAPIGLRSPLGWTIVGDVCNRSNNINVYKTFVSPDGQSSLLKPCKNKLTVKEVTATELPIEHSLDTHENWHSISTENQVFLEETDKFKKNVEGNWEAPLPFKNQRPLRLPNNQSLALNRANRFLANLRRDPIKHRHFLEFMQNHFDHKHPGDRRHVHFSDFSEFVKEQLCSSSCLPIFDVIPLLAV
jgi:hypothetical protein